MSQRLEEALVAAEQDAALVPSLRQQLQDVQQELAKTSSDLAAAREKIRALERRTRALRRTQASDRSRLRWQVTRAGRKLRGPTRAAVRRVLRLALSRRSAKS